MLLISSFQISFHCCENTENTKRGMSNEATFKLKKEGNENDKIKSHPTPGWRIVNRVFQSAQQEDGQQKSQGGTAHENTHQGQHRLGDESH